MSETFTDRYDRAFTRTNADETDTYSHPDLTFTVTAGTSWEVARRKADDMPPPGAIMTPVTYRHLGNGSLSSSSQQITTVGPDAWQELGNLPASAARVSGLADTSSLVGGLTGHLVVHAGRAGLRLTEIDLRTGTSRVLVQLLFSSQPTGVYPLEIRTAAPAPGPCLYVLEGQLVDPDSAATLRSALVSLYATVP